MAGRGPQTFNKRQKEQKRKEKQQEKLARRAQRQQDKLLGIVRPDDDSMEDGMPGLEGPLAADGLGPDDARPGDAAPGTRAAEAPQQVDTAKS